MTSKKNEQKKKKHVRAATPPWSSWTIFLLMKWDLTDYLAIVNYSLVRIHMTKDSTWHLFGIVPVQVHKWGRHPCRCTRWHHSGFAIWVWSLKMKCMTQYLHILLTRAMQGAYQSKISLNPSFFPIKWISWHGVANCIHIFKHVHKTMRLI